MNILVLLYLIALAVVNIQTLATDGMEGLTILPFEAFSLDNIHYTLVLYIVCLIASFLSVKSHFFDFEKGFGLGITNGSGGGYSDWAREKDIKTEDSKKPNNITDKPKLMIGNDLSKKEKNQETKVDNIKPSNSVLDRIKNLNETFGVTKRKKRK